MGAEEADGEGPGETGPPARTTRRNGRPRSGHAAQRRRDDDHDDCTQLFREHFRKRLAFALRLLESTDKTKQLCPPRVQKGGGSRGEKKGGGAAGGDVRGGLSGDLHLHTRHARTQDKRGDRSATGGKTTFLAGEIKC